MQSRLNLIIGEFIIRQETILIFQNILGMNKYLFTLIVCAIALFTSCGNKSTQIVTDGIGEFSVSANKKVTFSPGNLRYNPAYGTWAFAEHQVFCSGVENELLSTGGDIWIDLFCWSTSGNEDTKWGVTSTWDNKEFSGRFVDWGKTEIDGYEPNTWRTLTGEEWEYILYHRPNASSLCGIAQVMGVNGFVLLPDNWQWQSNIRFRNGILITYTEDFSIFQAFTYEQWEQLEQQGAVFLPAAGDRLETDYNFTFSDATRDDVLGAYWSSSKSSECLTLEEKSIVGNMAAYFTFQSNNVGVYEHTCVYGLSVRLVHDL